jgi:hypothetical protein
VIGRKWQLYNVQNARIFHDSQDGSHKKNIIRLAEMELLNRYYVMTVILGKKEIIYFVKLFVFESFIFISKCRRIKNIGFLPLVIMGKLLGLKRIILREY